MEIFQIAFFDSIRNFINERINDLFNINENIQKVVDKFYEIDPVLQILILFLLALVLLAGVFKLCSWIIKVPLKILLVVGIIYGIYFLFTRVL